jgi:hypothetical protein
MVRKRVYGDKQFKSNLKQRSQFYINSDKETFWIWWYSRMASRSSDCNERIAFACQSGLCQVHFDLDAYFKTSSQWWVVHILLWCTRLSFGIFVTRRCKKSHNLDTLHQILKAYGRASWTLRSQSCEDIYRVCKNSVWNSLIPSEYIHIYMYINKNV